jgi:hypothetical protein
VSGAPDGDAYAIRHELGLPHAFINTILYLDYDRRGFRRGHARHPMGEHRERPNSPQMRRLP